MLAIEGANTEKVYMRNLGIWERWKNFQYSDISERWNMEYHQCFKSSVCSWPEDFTRISLYVNSTSSAFQVVNGACHL